MGKQLAKREYETGSYRNEEIVNTINDALSQLEKWYCGVRISLGDALYESADSNTPIYTGDALGSAFYLEDYADNAVKEGLISMDESFSVTKLFQVAWCRLLEDAMCANVKTVIYNIMVNTLNDKMKEFDDGVDTDALESVLWEKAEDIDSSNTVADIQDLAVECYEGFITAK